MRILITNDDGCNSPLLVPLLDAVKKSSWCSELRVVTPDKENSWISQSITKHRPLVVTEHDFGSHPGFTVSGTPADCTSLGIANLFPDKPDLVLSGINMGTNAGLAFFLNSGTVGGAAAAFLMEIPAIAISLHFPKEFFSAYEQENSDMLKTVSKKWGQAARHSCSLVEKLIRGECWKSVDFFSVNLPWEMESEPGVEITRLQRVFYSSLFKKIENNLYTHDLGTLKFVKDKSEPKLTTDFHALHAGRTSLTPITYNHTSEVLQDVETLKKLFK